VGGGESQQGILRLVEQAAGLLLPAHLQLRGERRGEPAQQHGDDDEHHHHLDQREPPTEARRRHR
jgi:hypothetical protein